MIKYFVAFLMRDGKSLCEDVICDKEIRNSDDVRIMKNKLAEKYGDLIIIHYRKIMGERRNQEKCQSNYMI